MMLTLNDNCLPRVPVRQRKRHTRVCHEDFGRYATINRNCDDGTRLDRCCQAKTEISDQVTVRNYHIRRCVVEFGFHAWLCVQCVSTCVHMREYRSTRTTHAKTDETARAHNIPTLNTGNGTGLPYTSTPLGPNTCNSFSPDSAGISSNRYVPFPLS